MASRSEILTSVFLSLLMVLLAQTSYVGNGTVESTDNAVFKETERASSSLNLSTQFFPETFVDDASFLDSVRPESVSSGYSTTCVVFDDQTLSCSGYNYYGGLGSVTNCLALTPLQNTSK